MKVPFRILPLVISLIAIGLTGCLSGGGGGGGGGGSAAPTSPPTTTPTDPSTPTIPTTPTEPASAQINSVLSLSNDPILVSGGDVLVEVQVANISEAAADIVVKLNGEVVTNAFAVRGGERFVGLVKGLKVGENTIVASSKDNPSSSAQLVVKNHPSSGPIFSGPHLEPWICAQPIATQVTVSNPMNGQSAEAQTLVSGLSTAADENCGISSEVSYFYQPNDAASDCTFDTTDVNSCLVPFDTGNPPADSQIARFTNDRGDTVRSILVVERGALNRGMYSLTAFHDPERPHHPAQPQLGWNSKVIFSCGGGSGGRRFQSPPSQPFFNQRALRAGYMLATSSLNDHGTNANHALGAESLMMLKERIVETYGPIRYTVGTGGSGGAIVQLTMASSYPGLLDGLIPSLTYADALTNGIEIFDCGIFASTGYFGYMTKVPSVERNPLTLAVTGHSSLYHCASWMSAFLPSGNPTRAANCGAGFPESLAFHPVDNPGGIRCSHPEHNVNLLGSFTSPVGITKADQPLDNEGVQYGLAALQNGSISTERFIHLNENIGYYDEDQNLMAGLNRRVASLQSLERAYQSGMVTDGRYLANVPIIDIRYNEPTFDIHLNWRAKSVRDRLVNANGDHDNQVIWAYDQNSTSAPNDAAFDAMDRWLTAIESDESNRSLAEKVVSAKPTNVTDRCLVGGLNGEARDVGLDSSNCPIKFGKSPRQIAGGPVAEDILKCQLKPFDPNSTDYIHKITGNQIVFDEYSRYRMERVFSEGVCDWSKPGVAQQLNPGWMSFADGPDGVPLELTWFDRP
jgi:hypothetical protein